MSEIEMVITAFMFAFVGVTFIIIGELCGNKFLNSGHDVEYAKSKEPQTPPIPPKKQKELTDE